MIKKIITGIMSATLWFCVYFPASAQQNYPIKDTEFARRTNYKPISKGNFRFPSTQEALEVFEQGRKMLSHMLNTESSQKITPKHINFDTIHNFSDSLNVQHKYYQDSIQTSLNQAQADQDFKHYQNFYKQIIWKEDGTPDLTKVATLKSYLAFYNLIHNNGKPSRLQIGRIDEHFPLLGINADAFAELQQKFGNNDAYLWFTYELYYIAGMDYIILSEDAHQADEIAKQILYSKLQKYGITQKETDKWIEFATTWKSYEYFPDAARAATITIAYEGNWYYTMFLRPNIPPTLEGRPYNPIALVALHELQHIKDYFPGIIYTKFSLNELPTSLIELVTADDIYRQIHNIPYNQPIAYKHKSDFLGINLAEIAGFFRNLSKKYNTDNYAELLLKPEATKYIEDSYNKFAENAITWKLENSGTASNTISREDKQVLGRKSIHSSLEKIFKDTIRDSIFPH
ncbi:MAG: hypothetical protein J5594_03550 [Elusimicrobiaceae bacterium]|nr:hypothetical protein [Elusimicrobiaceae bacterium]